MPKPSRRRRGDQFWRDTVAARKQSGQSIAVFCAARGIGESTFFAKRRAIARKEQAPHAPASPPPRPSFAAVRVIPDPTVELSIPGGVVVRVPVGTDADAVARLVSALRGAPC